MAVEREDDRVVMGTRLYPLEGYPFALEVRIAYELSEAGLAVSTTALNIGERPCPYGAGQHPYLSAGGGLLDECTLELPARTRVLTDNARQLPSGEEPVEDTRFDFRSPRRLGEERLDYAFTDLIRESSGRAVARLGRPDGSCAELWADEHYSYLELYSGDTLAPQRRRRGLGVEPMTCPPNAFQSGEGVITLAPGQSLTTRWGARLL